ncbi:MAG: hypothetical protein RLZZ401_635 [Pseudomonadota bacterium]|jgi:hypothetical protein
MNDNRSMPATRRLFIAHAQRPWPPDLVSLLAQLTPTTRLDCPDDCPALPHELVLAEALGLPGPPGYTPWAAHATGTWGPPCAWITPCYWHVGVHDLTLTDPATLMLDEVASRALLAAMAPYFAQDGITLVYHSPTQWLAQGAVFDSLRCVSPARAMGQSVATWQGIGGSPAQALLRRLQNEMQMLLYTHPLNDTRHAQGLAPVNSFWVSGAGALGAPPASPAGIDDLGQWDAAAGKRLQARLGQALPTRLTLCGQHAAQTWEALPQVWWVKIGRKFSHSRIAVLLDTL